MKKYSIVIAVLILAVSFSIAHAATETPAGDANDSNIVVKPEPNSVPEPNVAPEPNAVPEPNKPVVKAKVFTISEKKTGFKYFSGVDRQTFHTPGCPWGKRIMTLPDTRVYMTRDEAIADDRKPCQNCKP